MVSQSFKKAGLQLDNWTYVKTNDPRILDGYHIQGFISELYLQKGDEELSMGVFYLNGKEVYRAWGVKKEPHCSYHAMVSPQGLSNVIDGCPEVKVEDVNGNQAKLVMKLPNEVVSHDITLLSQKKIFRITGLTCNNCVATVTEILNDAPEIKNAAVFLESGVVSIESITSLTAKRMNELLFDTKYRVLEFKLHSESPMLKKITTYVPLFVMLGGVLLFASAHQFVYGFHLHTFMQYFMAGYFLLFGGLKVINWRKFVPSYRAYDDIAKRSSLYAWAYPAIEFGLGIFYYVGLTFFGLHVFVFLLMIQKAGSVLKKVQSGEVVQCACLGGFFSIPVTWLTFTEDILMAGMAIWMLLY